jgi:hypothetical protein
MIQELFSFVYLDYKEELAGRKGFTRQQSLMIHEGMLMQSKISKKKKRKKDSGANSGYTSEGTGPCNEGQNWLTSDGWQQESHHKSKKKKKKHKKEHCDIEGCKRKRKLDEGIIEGSELHDTKRRKRDKHKHCVSA